MKAVVLLNEKSGACLAGATGPTATTIEAALEAAGIDAVVRCVPGDRLATEAKSAADEGADIVVASGGDGTISAVAGALAGGKTPLGILPTGTLNHFAKDLGVPLDLGEAVRVIATGRAVPVDVGVVNDRVFINNSSLGVYARALIERDANRDRWGLGKWPAMGLAALRVFWRSPLVTVRLEMEGFVKRKTPLVFVGNNRYRLDLFKVGARDRLDGGMLSLHVAKTSSRWGMLKLLARAAVGRLEQSRDLESSHPTSVWIETRHRRRHIAIDGEVVQMSPPFHFRVWPEALRVIVPAKPASSR
jgi:diacylglycerol kinase family enzyme